MAMKDRSIQLKVDPNFKRELDRIKFDRVIKSGEIKPASSRELTKRLCSMPEWSKIKLKLAKTGGIMDIFAFMIFALLSVIVVGIFIYMFSTANEVLSDVTFPTASEQGNWTEAVSETFGQVVAQANSMRTLAWVMIFSLVLTFLVSSAFAREHPAVIIIYILLLVPAIIGSIYISNAYESAVLGMDNALGETYREMSVANFLILYLPYLVAVIGIFSIIILAVLSAKGGHPYE